ncbi:inhibitor of growth protein 1-like [Dermatophagoides pteronyssinus]|uniref:inhibitor of growth protein 1-like n=1 Tax=Dermatophagoides pteronyssinus TaxID=6956 RepID=UPI003F6732A9
MANAELTAESAVFMYLQNYVDLTENFPNDMARLISEIHMIDVERTKYTKLMDYYKDKYLKKQNEWSNEEKIKILNKIEIVLLALEKESDTKLDVVRSMLEQIDLKSRQLDASYRLANTLSNQSNQANGLAGSSYSNSNSKNSNHQTSRHHENQSNGRNSPAFHSKEKDHHQSSNGTNKRMRRGSSKHNNHNNDYGSGDDRSSTPVASNQDRGTNQQSGQKRGGNNKRGIKTSSNNKTEKRGKSSSSSAAAAANSSNASYHNDDSQLNDDAYDPNEPTYCLCEQVSYGEMICCDNAQCSIEWFHFVCVNLTTKPKGKWYCPQCRGERSNIPRK